MLSRLGLCRSVSLTGATPPKAWALERETVGYPRGNERSSQVVALVIVARVRAARARRTVALPPPRLDRGRPILFRGKLHEFRRACIGNLIVWLFTSGHGGPTLLLDIVTPLPGALAL